MRGSVWNLSSACSALSPRESPVVRAAQAPRACKITKNNIFFVLSFVFIICKNPVKKFILGF